MRIANSIPILVGFLSFDIAAALAIVLRWGMSEFQSAVVARIHI